jgi:hypothetical protein
MKRVATLIALFFLICLPSLSFATDVGGIINTDTTWDLAGSPYDIVAPIEIRPNVTLTIEPGVTVNGGQIIDCWGTFNAVGTASSKITLRYFKIKPQRDQGESYYARVNIQFANITYLDLNGVQYSLTLSDSIITETCCQPIRLTYSLPGDSYIERNVFLNIHGIEVSGEANTTIYIRNNLFYFLKGWTIKGKDHDANSETIVRYNTFANTDRLALELDDWE